MQISIKGHQVAVTPALNQYVHERLGRLKERLQKATHAVVTFAGKRKHGLVPSIMITIHLAGKKVIVIKERMDAASNDFYATIAKVFDTLGTQLERFAGSSDKKHQAKRKVVLRYKQAMA